jgi:hypothetical protein
MIENETTDVLVESTAPATSPADTPKETSAAPEGEQTTQVEQETVTLTKQELADKLSRVEAKAEAKAERRAARAYRETLERFAPQQSTAPSDDGKPKREAFNGNDEAYVEALTDWKIDQRDRQTRQQREAEGQRQTATKTEKMYTEAAKLPTFDRDAFDELPITPVIAQTIIDSDVAPQLMAWMAANPADVERISKLPPARQSAEIGKLEARLSVPRTTREPPAPIKTVGGGGSVSNGDFAKMTDDEYYAARLKQKPSWGR